MSSEVSFQTEDTEDTEVTSYQSQVSDPACFIMFHHVSKPVPISGKLLITHSSLIVHDSTTDSSA